MKFKVGDKVRVGGKISSADSNFGKRGTVVDYDGDTPVVKMKDTFSSGSVRIAWLDEDSWVYDCGFIFKPIF